MFSTKFRCGSWESKYSNIHIITRHKIYVTTADCRLKQKFTMTWGKYSCRNNWAIRTVYNCDGNMTGMLANLSGSVIPGSRLVTLGDDDDCGTSQYKRPCCRVSELTMQRAMRPWLHPKAFFNMTTLGRRYVQCLSVLHGFTNKVSLCLFHES